MVRFDASPIMMKLPVGWLETRCRASLSVTLPRNHSLTSARSSTTGICEAFQYVNTGSLGCCKAKLARTSVKPTFSGGIEYVVARRFTRRADCTSTRQNYITKNGNPTQNQTNRNNSRQVSKAPYPRGRHRAECAVTRAHLQARRT